MRCRIGCAVMLVLGLAVVTATRAQDTGCDKNHYILDAPACSMRALDVPIGAPGAIAADVAGNVYFSVPNLIFKVDTRGALTRVAGSLDAGDAGDGGPALVARLDFPLWYPNRIADPLDFDPCIGALAVGAERDIYVSDCLNGRIRRIDANGIITTVAQAAGQGIAINAAGNLVIDGFEEVAANGTFRQLAKAYCGQDFVRGLCDPQGVATDALGNTYVSDIYCRVRKIDADGKITTVAGDSAHEGRCAYSGDGGPANSAALAWPIGLATDAQGNLYIADTGNHCIRKVDGGGVITTFAGICTAWPRRGPLADGSGYSGDEGPATAARLHSPQGVAVDGAGNVYIADTGNSRIRKVDASGTITTVAGNGQPLVLP